MKIAVIIGSTRPGRVGESVAKWVFELAKKRTEAEFELVDIKDFNLPLLDEPVPPSMGQYSQQHTKTWAAKIDSFDGYVFVTPEYNHGICGALKNAIDFLFREWNNKAAGFVGYGSVGGVRAVEHLRLVMAEVQVATVRNQVALSLVTDFENYTTFKPDPRHEKSIRAPATKGGLAADGLVYRYLRGQTSDGLAGDEGTFNLCSFWLVEALIRSGRTDPARLADARLLFEQMLGYGNHLGLYAEQTGPSGEALGNFPQAFTHLALISAAFNLDRALRMPPGG